MSAQCSLSTTAILQLTYVVTGSASTVAVTPGTAYQTPANQTLALSHQAHSQDAGGHFKGARKKKNQTPVEVHPYIAKVSLCR